MYLKTSVHAILIGIYTVIGPIYSSEMSPSHLRGKLGVTNILFSSYGGMVGIIVAGLFSIDFNFAYSYGWRLGIQIFFWKTDTFKINLLLVKNSVLSFILSYELRCVEW